MDRIAWVILQQIIQAQDSQELVQIPTAEERAEGQEPAGSSRTAVVHQGQERRPQDLREQAGEGINRRLVVIKHLIPIQAEQTIRHRLQQIQVQADRQPLRQAVALVLRLRLPQTLADQVLHRHPLIQVQVRHLPRVVVLPRHRRVAVEADVPDLLDATKTHTPLFVAKQVLHGIS